MRVGSGQGGAPRTLPGSLMALQNTHLWVGRGTALTFSLERAEGSCGDLLSFYD